MLTSIVSLDRNFSVNDVDIMGFEPCFLFSPRSRFGGGEGRVDFTHGPSKAVLPFSGSGKLDYEAGCQGLILVA